MYVGDDLSIECQQSRTIFDIDVISGAEDMRSQDRRRAFRSDDSRTNNFSKPPNGAVLDHAGSALHPPTDDDRSLLLTVEDVARLLKISIRSVWRLHSAGALPDPMPWELGSVRWRRTDIETWVVAGRPDGNNDR
jgi:predicted DNA-binding transcriptional regulator AlpA